MEKIAGRRLFKVNVKWSWSHNEEDRYLHYENNIYYILAEDDAVARNEATSFAYKEITKTKFQLEYCTVEYICDAVYKA